MAKKKKEKKKEQAQKKKAGKKPLKDNKCKTCKAFKEGECHNEGALLFTHLASRYCGLGFTTKEAGHKAFIRPQVDKNHSGCPHWRK